jgi:hypothetical protein
LVDNQNGLATLGGVPEADSGGVYKFTITAGGISQDFVLTVLQPPIFVSVASADFATGQEHDFTIQTSGFGDAKIGAYLRLPHGVKLKDNHNGTATLSIASTVDGTFTLTFIATLKGQPTAEQSFTLSVN